MDSWYTSQKLVEVCNAKWFYFIGAAKSNRTICPADIRIQLGDFAIHHIQKSDLRSVSVENKWTCWIYEYKGPLADIENVRVLVWIRFKQTAVLYPAYRS
jgi:hypothetical protein